MPSVTENERQTLIQLSARREHLSFQDALDLMPPEGNAFAAGCGVLYVAGNMPIAQTSAPVRIDDVADITVAAPIPYRARSINELALWEKITTANPRLLTDGHVRALTTEAAMQQYEDSERTQRAVDAKEREMIRGFVNATHMTSSGKFTRMGARGGETISIPPGKPIESI